MSTGFGTKELAEAYEADHDDYNSIMIKALADRLAEAFAEYLHKEVRTNHWGYAFNERSFQQRFNQRTLQGNSSSTGLASLSRSLEKRTLWDLLKCGGKNWCAINR